MMISTDPGRTRARFFAYVSCALALLLIPVLASAQLMLYPTRVVFEGNERAAQVELINNAVEEVTYRISLVNRRMGEAGGLEEVHDPLPDERFADGLLRYSPRQVTLGPGAGQTVRIMVRKSAGLATGEYRSHLMFTQQPGASRAGIGQSRDANDDAIAVKLTMLVGTSIPIIVRHGATEAAVALTDLGLIQAETESPLLAFQMERNGNQSVYGDLSVAFKPEGGLERVIARANGVAVYTPNSVRRASMALDAGGLRLSRGMFRLTYREQAEAGSKVLAEAFLPVP